MCLLGVVIHFHWWPWSTEEQGQILVSLRSLLLLRMFLSYWCATGKTGPSRPIIHFICYYGIVCIELKVELSCFHYSCMDEGSHKDFKKRCGGGVIKFSPENNTLSVVVSLAHLWYTLLLYPISQEFCRLELCYLIKTNNADFYFFKINIIVRYCSNFSGFQ